MAYYAEGDSPIVTTGNAGNCGSGFGWGGNDAWVLIILFALIFGWGRGEGFGANGTAPIMMSGLGTDAQLQRGFDTANIVGKLDGINYGLSDGFYAVNTGMLNGFAGVQQTLCQGFSGVNNAITTNGYETRSAINDLGYRLQDCCCHTQRAIDGVNYNLAKSTCDITNALSSSTRDIIDSQRESANAIMTYLTSEKISSLQAENSLLTAQLSQNSQTSTIINALTPKVPVPAFCVPTPYNYGSVCGTGCGCATAIQ